MKAVISLTQVEGVEVVFIAAFILYTCYMLDVKSFTQVGGVEVLLIAAFILDTFGLNFLNRTEPCFVEISHNLIKKL